MYSRSANIFTFCRESETHWVCSLYTHTDPHAAKRGEPCSRWSKAAFDVRPVFDGGKFDSPEHRASCYEHNKAERSDRTANQKGRDCRRMQQILLSAHHEPSWTPSLLICSQQNGLNLDPRTCPPAIHSTSECCYGTCFFFINLLAKLHCAVLPQCHATSVAKTALAVWLMHPAV